MKVYLVLKCESIESGSGFETVREVRGIFSVKEEAEKVSTEGNEVIRHRYEELFKKPVFEVYSWYEVEEHEVI